MKSDGAPIALLTVAGFIAQMVTEVALYNNETRLHGVGNIKAEYL